MHPGLVLLYVWVCASVCVRAMVITQNPVAHKPRLRIGGSKPSTTAIGTDAARRQGVVRVRFWHRVRRILGVCALYTSNVRGGADVRTRMPLQLLLVVCAVCVNMQWVCVASCLREDQVN